MAGSTGAMNPRPDHGEESYKGAGRLAGKKAIITGGDSGIGRAVAIAYAREGADILIAYLDEDEDAAEVRTLIEREGRKAVLMPGDIRNPDPCRSIVRRAVAQFGGVDILVNNAAHQATFKKAALLTSKLRRVARLRQELTTASPGTQRIISLFSGRVAANLSAFGGRRSKSNISTKHNGLPLGSIQSPRAT
jgi:NAD(P)-dependent dehydrogenase (short-subunit alcohol dehydrogenase family)